MEEILKGLQRAEYVHVILNHLPIVGLAMGLLVLSISIFQRSRATSIAAYLVITLMALSVIPVTKFGEKAVDQMESLLDKPARQWLNEHAERAERTAWMFYVTAAFGVCGLFLPRFAPRSSLAVAGVTLVFGTATLLGGFWVASAGGKSCIASFVIPFRTRPNRHLRQPRPDGSVTKIAEK